MHLCRVQNCPKGNMYLSKRQKILFNRVILFFFFNLDLSLSTLNWKPKHKIGWNRFISYPSSPSHRLRHAQRDLLSLRISLFPESRISFNLTNRPTSLGAAHHRGTGLAVSCADQPCLSTLNGIVQHDNYGYDYLPHSPIQNFTVLNMLRKKGYKKFFSPSFTERRQLTCLYCTEILRLKEKVFFSHNIKTWIDYAAVKHLEDTWRGFQVNLVGVGG